MWGGGGGSLPVAICLAGGLPMQRPPGTFSAVCLGLSKSPQAGDGDFFLLDRGHPERSWFSSARVPRCSPLPVMDGAEDKCLGLLDPQVGQSGM